MEQLAYGYTETEIVLPPNSATGDGCLSCLSVKVQRDVHRHEMYDRIKHVPVFKMQKVELGKQLGKQ